MCLNMRLKFLSIIVLLCLAIHAKAQSSPEKIVASFGEALSSWCSTGEIVYREKIDELCSGVKSCRVEDKIHADYQKGNGLIGYETFVLDSYMSMFQSLMSMPSSVNYTMSNVKVVGSDEMPDGTLTFITADIKVTGALNQTVTDLFLVRDNKITGIYSYSSKLSFSHLNGSLIKALQIGRYSIDYMAGFRSGRSIIQNEAGKCGLIDNKGEVIIPCMWDDIFYFGGALASGIEGPESSSMTLRTYDLRFNGKVVPVVYYQYFGWSPDFEDGFMPVPSSTNLSACKFGYLKEDDYDYKVQYVYDFAGTFSNGYAYVIQNGIRKIIDKTFTTIVQSNSRYTICGSFYEGLAKIQDTETGKFGFVNTKGQIAIPCMFDEVDNFSEGMCCVYKFDQPSRHKYDQSKHFGYINKKGEVVIPISYDSSDGRSVIWSRDFEDGYVDIYIRGTDSIPQQATLIGKDGNPLPGFSWYTEINRFEEGFALYRENKYYGYLNRDGSIAIKPTFEIAMDFKNGYACVGKTINGEDKWGCINTDGVLIIPYIYDDIFEFENGIALVQKDNKVGLIDVYGNSIFFP